MKKTMRYFIGKHLTCKPGSDEWMPLDRIEELLMVSKPMLGYLVEDLTHKGKVNEAKGIVMR